jgi:DNA polymerase elongation subunit (family B)
MFNDVKNMTIEELEKELQAIQTFEKEIGNINVNSLLNKTVDTSFLKVMKCTVTPNGQLFRIDNKGFLPEMLEEMYNDRKKYKKLMLVAQQEYEDESDEAKKFEISKRVARYNNLQLAKKLGLNSSYGVMGSKYFRFFDLRMAAGITTGGQLSIRWIMNKLNEYMNTLLKTEKDYVIASDTDSIYLRLSELVEKVYSKKTDVNQIISFMDRVCEDKIQPHIDKSYQELATYVNAYAQKMQMKREALSDKGIWTAKKRYILNVYNNEGVQYKEPHLKVMGLQMIQSSTPAEVRVKMKEIIKIIINGNQDDVHKFIADFREYFKKLPPEDISFPRGLNGLKKYSDSVTMYKNGTPAQVKGAIFYNDLLQKKGLTKTYPMIQEGEKIKYTYLKMPNPLRSPIISYPSRIPKEFGLDQYIDYNLMFDKSFIDPIKVILDCVGWSTEKRNTLDSFFI